MPGLPKLSLVEGSFEELSLEFATFLDNAKGESSNLVNEITPLLADADDKSDPPKETDRDEVLKKLVGASSVLNNAPERELAPAYNMLIHLVSQSEEPDPFLARICQYLTQPITSSSHNSAGLALSVLSNLFNTVQPDDETRYHVLMTVVKAIKNSGNFETLLPQLKNVDNWVDEWELEPKEARELYLAISDAAAAAKEPEQSYFYLLKGVRTIQNDAASQQARELSIRALKLALQNVKHFDFQDLTALDSIQALRKSDSTWTELLELFSAQNYDDFQDFKEADGSFLPDNGLDEDILDKKMRQLTLASLSAQAASSRTLPYGQIAKALQVPTEDVEMWVIDSIRSGLVEGKLSQQKQEFLIHRSTYRVFGESQWREVASRLETWKASLTNVLAVIRAQKEDFQREKEQEANGPSQNGQGYRGNMSNMRNRNQPDRSQQQQQQPKEVEAE